MVRPAGTVLVTVGRQSVRPFFERGDIRIVARMIEPPCPEWVVPDNVEILLQRPPFSRDHEDALFDRFAVTTLVTKNAGGDAVAAKLGVAHARGCDVIMIERPIELRPPDAVSVDEIVALLAGHAD